MRSPIPVPLSSHPHTQLSATPIQASDVQDLSGVLAHAGGRPAGAILVVERSIWDDHLDGPFVIDRFVHPEARGLGLGRSLVLAAMEACTSAGDRQLSLRVGQGTSAAAHGLYRGLGFTTVQTT